MTPGTAFDVSIIVLNYNTREHLRACLRSVLEEGSTTLSRPDAPLSAELIVVDNSSVDESAELVEREFAAATLMRSPRNGGFAYGNNIALRRARGRLFLLLNPDAEVPPGGIAGLLSGLSRHPAAGVVGPKLLRGDGTMHLACRRSFPSPAVAFYRLVGLSQRYAQSPRFGRYNLTFLDPDLETEVDAVTGACMLLRREAVEQAGLLDERFFMYGEDLDWCWRIKECGWTVWYVPAVQVAHHHGAASRRRPFRATYHFFRAMDLFYRKHYARRYNPLLTAAIVAGIHAGMAVSLVRLAAMPPDRRRVGF